MTYSSKRQKSRENAHNHLIATKIIHSMEKLRSEVNETSERRWIWELLQNAKDVRYDDKQITIEINYQTSHDKSILEFRHNGQPFSMDNITFLIEQVSTKDQELKNGKKSKTTGKFGTGFLTTHLLSKKVAVEGVLKEPDEPYKKFNLLLDRASQEINDIINSVDKSLSLIDDLDNQEPYIHYDRNNFNTTFSYQLDKKGISVAKIGLDDLHISIPFTLVFLPEIESVTILNDNISYEVFENISLNDVIQKYTIKKKIHDSIDDIKIIVLSSNNTSIAIEIEEKDKQIYLKEFSLKVPKLFCDFPLIGTEDFHFPVIISSSDFNPNEPRNGVSLIDMEDGDSSDKVYAKIIENKDIISDAVNLYYQLLEYASANNWQNIHLLAKIKQPKNKDWISQDWFNDNVLKPVRAKLLQVPIVDTEKGERVPIVEIDSLWENLENIHFPDANTKDLRERIWDLSDEFSFCKLPRRVDIHKWHEIIWDDCEKQTIEKLTKDIKDSINIETLSKKLNKNEEETINWLNSYYDLLNLEGHFIDKIINDQYAVIPNQNGEFKTSSELYMDEDIEEELKNVLSLLDVDSRDYLLHKKVNLQNNYTEKDKKEISLYTKTQDEIIENINQILREQDDNDIIDACNYLIALFPQETTYPEKRTQIYDFCKTIYPKTISDKRIIKTGNNNIWEEADNIKIRQIIEKIAKATNIETLTINLQFENDKQTLEWLNSFISFLLHQGEYDSWLNLRRTPILPNQNGEFVVKEDLSKEEGEINTILKDISKDLEYDYRNELLDVRITSLKFSDNRKINQQDIANTIKNLVNAIVKPNDKQKRVYRKLILWFNEYPQIAKTLFGDLYLHKHKLYDENEIAENMQKAEELEGIMTEFDVKNMQELRTRLTQNNQTKEEPKEIITKEILASWGIMTPEDLEEAFQNNEFSSNFFHTSKPTTEMYEYSQKLIERAKENVIKYLKTIGYDCKDVEPAAKTIINGIKKDGTDITIVVRPSDNNVVLIYYESEKAALEEANAELWVENGIDTPQYLTLGRILRTTGITRIPIGNLHHE